MTKTEALEKTIYNLENNVYEYRWSSPHTCNCGVLAKTVLGGKNIFNAGFSCTLPKGRGGAFSSHAICITTGIEVPEIFKTLSECGFSHNDLIELEFLSNTSILSKLGQTSRYNEFIEAYVISSSEFDNKGTLIKYLKAWVQILKEEQPTVTNVEPQPKTETKPVEKIRYVSVPTTITEKQKELILN